MSAATQPVLRIKSKGIRRRDDSVQSEFILVSENSIYFFSPLGNNCAESTKHLGHLPDFAVNILIIIITFFVPQLISFCLSTCLHVLFNFVIDI